jgi:hypothetical protein
MRAPIDQTILIEVDPHTLKFRYKDESGEDARQVRVINGDRLIWVLGSSISDRTFQIDFGKINPYQLGRPFAMRGIDHLVSPEVRFPMDSSYNRFLKYSVSLGTGWRDDPDVVPVPADPFTDIFRGGGPNCDIFWTDVHESAIRLSTPHMEAQATNAPLDRARVFWGWRVGEPDIQSFTLTFNPNDPDPAQLPPGWPRSRESTDDNPRIELYLPKGFEAPRPFRITTTARDGETIYKDGDLLIS